MTKLISTLLISLSLFLQPTTFNNSLPQGVYTVKNIADYQNFKFVRNLSKTKTMILIILDENLAQRQYIYMKPQSATQEYKLIELKEGYRIIVSGDDEVYLD